MQLRYNIDAIYIQYTNRSKVRSTGQQIKNKINRLRAISTYKRLDQQTDRSKVWSTHQTLQMKIMINISKVKSTDKKLDQQIKGQINRLKDSPTNQNR